MTAGPLPSLDSTAPDGGFWPADGVDLSDITDDVLGIAVPRFADGAAVFVLERHLASAAAAGVSAEADPGPGPGPDSGPQAIARRLGPRFAGPPGLVAPGAFLAGEVVAFAAASPTA